MRKREQRKGMDRPISEGGMRTRAGGKRAAAKLACSASHVLFSLDLIRMLLPIIDFRSFVALRACCTEVRARIQEACEELIGVLERAAAMYVTPDFKTALHIAHDYDVHFGWLLQTPALATGSLITNCRAAMLHAVENDR